MDNLIDKIVAYIKSLSREDIILLLFILSPAILTTILMAIGEADQREIMTPEERKQMGFDHFDEMERTYQQSKRKKGTLDPGKASKGKTEFDKEDFYDIVDYNGGLDGEYSNIDYHDLEDYYGD